MVSPSCNAQTLWNFPRANETQEKSQCTDNYVDKLIQGFVNGSIASPQGSAPWELPQECQKTLLNLKNHVKIYGVPKEFSQHIKKILSTHTFAKLANLMDPVHMSKKMGESFLSNFTTQLSAGAMFSALFAMFPIATSALSAPALLPAVVATKVSDATTSLLNAISMNPITLFLGYGNGTSYCSTRSVADACTEVHGMQDNNLVFQAYRVIESNGDGGTDIATFARNCLNNAAFREFLEEFVIPKNLNRTNFQDFRECLVSDFEPVSHVSASAGFYGLLDDVCETLQNAYISMVTDCSHEPENTTSRLYFLLLLFLILACCTCYFFWRQCPDNAHDQLQEYNSDIQLSVAITSQTEKDSV